MQQGRVAFGNMDAVTFGTPMEEAIAHEVERIGAERVFLMVSGTLNRETGEIEKPRRALGNKVVGEFDKMAPHTPRGDVIKAAAMAREAKADLIVTFGGGSLTDGAKAVSLCLANDIDTPEGMDRLRDGPDTLTAPTVRQISIPTTLSGGEFSAISGVTDERTSIKELFRHPDIMPIAVILDPAPTVHTPEWLFLSTGIRAVDNCVEGSCAKEANPWTNTQALQGLSLLTKGLARVNEALDDIETRFNCLMGTWMSMAALAAGVPMGASHGIGYVLGAVHDVPHGHTSCIMLPYVMRWNKSVNAAQQAEVARAMGCEEEDAGDALDRFIGGLGMPRTLSAAGVKPEHFDRISKQAMGTPWIPRNPRPIPIPAEVMEILALAK